MDEAYTRLTNAEGLLLDGGSEGSDEVESLPGDDLPIDIPYAQELVFWKHLTMSLVFGAFMGLVGYGYLECIETVQKKWWGDDYGSQTTVEFGQGRADWFWIMPLGGLLVGICKVVVRMPERIHGFMKEVQEQHVDPITAPKVVLVSLLSLCAGTSLGPEAALGSLGGGLAQFWSGRRGLSKEMTQRHVVDGMCGAMGCLFPSPAIAVACMAEIGKVEQMHTKYMESMVLMTMASSMSFGVYYALKDSSYLLFNPIALTYEFQSGDQFKAAVIGVVSSLFGLTHIIVAGICKRVFKMIGSKIRNRQVRTVLLPIIGAVLLSAIAHLSPLTLGSGTTQTATMVKLAITKDITYQVLFVAAIMKSFAFGISKSAGFIGGAIFPMIFVGNAWGLAFYLLLHDPNKTEQFLPLVLSSSCFMVGVPAAVSPMPLTLLMLVAFSFQLGAYQSTPIFVCAIVAHATINGLGILKFLIDAARRRHLESR